MMRSIFTGANYTINDILSVIHRLREYYPEAQIKTSIWSQYNYYYPHVSGGIWYVGVSTIRRGFMALNNVADVILAEEDMYCSGIECYRDKVNPKGKVSIILDMDRICEGEYLRLTTL